MSAIIFQGSKIVFQFISLFCTPLMKKSIEQVTAAIKQNATGGTDTILTNSRSDDSISLISSL